MGQWPLAAGLGLLLVLPPRDPLICCVLLLSHVLLLFLSWACCACSACQATHWKCTATGTAERQQGVPHGPNKFKRSESGCHARNTLQRGRGPLDVRKCRTGEGHQICFGGLGASLRHYSALAGMMVCAECSRRSSALHRTPFGWKCNPVFWQHALHLVGSFCLMDNSCVPALR